MGMGGCRTVLTWPFDEIFEFLNQCQSLLCAKCSCQLLTTLDKLLPVLPPSLTPDPEPMLGVPFNDCFKIQLFVLLFSRSHWHFRILLGLSLFSSSADENPNYRFSHYRFTLLCLRNKLFQKVHFVPAISFRCRSSHRPHWLRQWASQYFSCLSRSGKCFFQ